MHSSTTPDGFSGRWINPADVQSFADRHGGEPGEISGQIATRLAAGSLSGFMGSLPNPDPILKAMGRDITVYRNLLVDPLIMGIRRRRCSAVLSMQRGFDKDAGASPPRVRAAVEKWFKTIDVQQLVRELMDGAFYGYRVGEVMWAARSDMLAPTLIAKPCEWFGFSDDGELLFKRRGSPKGAAVDPRKFVVVGKMRSWENPYGEPDLAACFWPVTFKRGGMKFWVTFTEKYGSPWAVGKLPRTASKVEVDQLADDLAGMVRDAVAVIPDDASVELIQTGGTANAEMYEKLLMFCRSEISIALLGNNQSVEMQSNQASATAAREIEKDLRDDDAAMVADGINQLVRLFCEANFEGARPPVYCFWEQRKVDVLQASRDEKLRAAGARFTPTYFERVYNLRPGDVVEPKAPTKAPFKQHQIALLTPGAASFADGPAPAPSLSVVIFKLSATATLNGVDQTLGMADLRGIASRYDFALHEAPFTLGMARHDDPAFGWVQRLTVTSAGFLVAEATQVNEEFLRLFNAGKFTKIIARFYAPSSSNNPSPGQYYLRDVGFVGAGGSLLRRLSRALRRLLRGGDGEDHVSGTLSIEGHHA